MPKSDDATDARSNVVAVFCRHLLSDFGIAESSYMIRLSPKLVAASETIGRSLALIAFGFLMGCWFGYHGPSEADMMMQRIKHRAALIQLEQGTEAKLSGKK